MNKVKLLSILVVVLATANLLSIGFMFFMRPHGHGGPDGPKRMIEEVLKLDDQQKDQFDALVKTHHEAFKSITEGIQSARTALLQTQKKDALNPSETDSLIGRILDGRKQVELLNLKHFQDIKALCKPEQRARFEDLMDKISEATQRPMRPF